MIFEFRAKILDIINLKGENFLILDKTAFYPTGGGQEHDTGFIINENGNKLKVIDVIKVKGNTVLHKIEGDINKFKIGDEVLGSIDKRRRLLLTRQHDAVHLLNGVAQDVLGKHIWQAGSYVGPNKAHLDITHYKKLTQNDIDEIEEKINNLIFEGAPINKFIMDRVSAESKYGIRIYQGGAIPGKYLRIVEIEGIDIEACGGTHGNNIKDISNVFIRKYSKIQDGIYRLEILAEENAYREYYRLKSLLNESSKYLSVPIEDVPKTSKKFFEAWKEEKKEIEKLSGYLMENALSLLEKSDNNIVYLPLDNKYLFQLIKKTEKLLENDKIIVGKYSKENLKKLEEKVKKEKIKINKNIIIANK